MTTRALSTRQFADLRASRRSGARETCARLAWTWLVLALVAQGARAQQRSAPAAQDKPPAAADTKIVPDAQRDAAAKSAPTSADESTPQSVAAPSATHGTASPPDELAVDEARLADRYERLEQVMLRLAELSATSDPRRAEILRQVIAQSKQRDISVRFESVVELLERERLAAALKNQDLLKTDLDQLLALLLKENRAERLESEQRRIRRYLKEVNRLIRRQRGVRARTEGGDDKERLADTQGKIAGDTGKLADEIGADGKSESKDADRPSPDEDQPQSSPDDQKPDDQKDGKGQEPEQPQPGQFPDGHSQDGRPQQGQPQQGQPQQGQPQQGQPQQGQPQEGEPQPAGQSDTQQASDQLQQAQQRMQQALERLEKAQREGAVEQQQQALEALEKARQQLEEILRQLREEQREQMLAMLEARFRKMLKVQTEIYEGTKRLHEVPLAQRDHNEEIEAGRLSRHERELVREADQALRLLAADGTSLAFPEAVEQMRDDMQLVAERLLRVEVGEITQGVEEDIIAALEEMVAALEKAQKDLEAQKGKPRPGQPTDPALVDQLAELKMIRALQMRVNRRTDRYCKMLDGQRANQPELLEALDRLAERERRIFQATRDLHLEKNQ